MISASPLLGTSLHAVGAICAALCYTPQHGLRRWSWDTYWLAQAAVCWFLAPIIGAMLTIPHLDTVLTEAPKDAMWKSFALGAAYGIGGTAFGLAIRHVGYSLTYAIAVGISSVLGTLTGPLISGTLKAMMHKPGAAWVLGGVGIGAVGIALCGIAGRLKELDLQAGQNADTGFSLAKGLPLCFLAGVLSAVYGFSLEAGQPIADVAAKYGADYLQGNVIYIFSNSGAFLTTAIYSLWQGARQRTLGEFRRLPVGGALVLAANYALAILTGCLWYSQFFFYGLGHVRMGEYKFSSWAIHMIMLILFSNLAGLLMREWKHCRPRTLAGIAIALLVLSAAVLTITYGNYLGDVQGAGK